MCLQAFDTPFNGSYPTNSKNTLVLRTRAMLRGCVLALQQYLRCLLWKTKFRAEFSVDLKICECVKTGVNFWSASGGSRRT